MFQIRAETNTHCASYIVDELTADRTDKLDNGCQFSVNVQQIKGVKHSLKMSLYQIENRENGKVIFMCEKSCEYLLSVFFKRKQIFMLPKIRVLCLYVSTCFFIRGHGGARGASHMVILFNP